MATNSRFKAFLDCYGPSGSVVAYSKITIPISGAAITILDAQGMTPARTGVGIYTFTLACTPKSVVVTTGLESASTVTSFAVTSIVGKVVTVKAMTAGTATVVDPTVAVNLHVTAVCRIAS